MKWIGDWLSSLRRFILLMISHIVFLVSQLLLSTISFNLEFQGFLFLVYRAVDRKAYAWIADSFTSEHSNLGGGNYGFWSSFILSVMRRLVASVFCIVYFEVFILFDILVGLLHIVPFWFFSCVHIIMSSY